MTDMDIKYAHENPVNDKEKYPIDDTVKDKWIQMASDTNSRAYKNWYFYSDVTTGTSIAPYSCEPLIESGIDYVNPGVTLAKSGSTSLPNRAVKNFNTKQKKALFPANRPFFVYDLPIQQRQILEANNTQKLAMDRATEVAAGWALEFLQNTKKVYRNLPNLFDALTMTGNSMMFMGHKKEDPAVFISPANFVVRRTQSGMEREAIIREVIALTDLSPELQTVVKENYKVPEQAFSNKQVEQPELTTIQKFTYIEYELDGSCQYTEYVENIKVGATKKVPKEEPRFIIVAPNRPEGANYGVGIVQQCLPSILQLYGGAKAIANVNALIGEAKYYAKPNMVGGIRQMQQGGSGKYLVVNNPDDIGMLPVTNININPSEVATAMAKEEIAKTFIMTGDAVRDAERVTAFEIRKMADDITSVHDNWLADIAEQLQEKLVQYATYHMDLTNSEGVPVKDNLLEMQVKIITGSDAIDKVSESDNLLTAIQEFGVFTTINPEDKSIFKRDKVASTMLKARGVASSEYIKSDEELAAEAEAAQKARERDMATEAQLKQMSNSQPE